MPGTPIFLALGDSITAGYGVGLDKSFATIYYRVLRNQGRFMQYSNLGMNGLDSAGLAALMRENRRVRTTLAQAQIVTLTVGSNDVLTLVRGRRISPGTVLSSMGYHLMSAGSVIRELNPYVTLYVATIYNPLPAGPFAQLAKQGQGIIDQANSVLASWASRYAFRLVRVDRVFRGQERILIGPDYIHPGEAGHQAIAGAFARAGQ